MATAKPRKPGKAKTATVAKSKPTITKPEAQSGITELVWVEASSLSPNPRNWRKHPTPQVQALQASIRENGWAGALLYNKTTGRLIDGHARKELVEMSGNAKVPVLMGYWTEEQERRLLTSLDPIAGMAQMDAAMLQGLLAEVSTEDTSFQKLLDDLDKQANKLLLAQEGNLPDDTAPAKPKTPITKPGDIWQLGTHRLCCGDATDPETVSRLLGTVIPFLMVTDPPYGVGYDPSWRIAAAATGNIKYGATRTGEVLNDNQADWSQAYSLFPGRVAYVWFASLEAPTAGKALVESGFDLRSLIVWRKPRLSISRGHYHWQHEPCFYAVRRGGASAKWCGDRSQSTMWDIDPVGVSHNTEHRSANGEDPASNHGTQKPVECMARPIRNHGTKSDCVYDPFVGSGTTIIACEHLGRSCFAVELDPGYCDVAVKRWENLTGKRATKVKS